MPPRLRPAPFFLSFAALLVVFSIAPRVSATTLRAWELPDFVAHSRAALVGTVTEVTVRNDAEARMIHTYVTLQVEEVLAGARLSGEIVLREMGGRVGKRVTIVHGVPVYRPGERVLVFVEELADGTLRTLGFYQGKYTRELEADTGRELYVQRSPIGIDVYASETAIDAAPAVVRHERAALEAEIRALGGSR